jgi:hypothetical protein
LVWDLGDIPGGAAGPGIAMTVTVAPGTAAPATYYPDIRMAGTLPEVDLANNLSRPAVFVGRRTFLPLVVRNSW